jgi:peroxiredoxin
MTGASARLEELAQRFAALGPELPDGPYKAALSVLHAMILEVGRQRPAVPGEAGLTLAHIANLYRSAPPMEGAAENPGLAVGASAPDFTLPDANGQPVRLSDRLRAGGLVLLVFYPLDWSPACSDQLSLYQSELAEFERYHTQVIGLSVDSVYSHGAWAAVRGLTFPLLADFSPKGEVARRYQVYRAGDGFSERALYVIDSAGLIRYAHVSPQLHHVPDIYALFEQLAALAPEGG